MIRAVFWQNPQKHIYKFSVIGHAGYGEKGSDIVCAAASALVYSTVNGLTEIIGIPVDCLTADGEILCQLPDNRSKENSCVQILLKTLRLGYQSLKREYPNNITVKTITLSLSGGEDHVKNEHSTICS